VLEVQELDEARLEDGVEVYSRFLHLSELRSFDWS